MNQANNKMKLKAIKLWEMSKSNNEGEASNAKSLLDKYLDQHDIDAAELFDEKVQRRFYPYKQEIHEDLFQQCTRRVFGKDKTIFLYKKGRVKELVLELTEAEHINFLDFWQFHLRHFDKEYKNFTKKQNETFVSAYIYNHNLYAPEGEDEEKSEPSKGDRPDVSAIISAMGSMEKADYHKKLTAGGS